MRCCLFLGILYTPLKREREENRKSMDRNAHELTPILRFDFISSFFGLEVFKEYGGFEFDLPISNIYYYDNLIDCMLISPFYHNF